MSSREGRHPLSPAIIISAYLNGFYPMASGRYGEAEFYYYEPRAIIPLDERFKIRKSLRKVIDSSIFRVTHNEAFKAVITHCARYDSLPNEQVWISEEMIDLYCELHSMGIAHSVEVWEGDQLVGGLYGLSFGKAFCGESMFSTRAYASQVALVGLVEKLRKEGFVLLDAQMESEHLQQFGAYTVSQEEYLRLFAKAATSAVDRTADVA